jgi:hypothetical protein
MPNFQELQDTIKESCKQPLVMVSLSRGEVASKQAELRAFTDGRGYLMVSNLTKVHSLFGGAQLSPVEKASTKTVSGDDFKTFDDLVTMKSNPLDGTEVPQLIGVDPDLAFALAGEEVNCPVTGKLTKMEYFGETAMSNEDDGEEEITDVDMTDDEEDALEGEPDDSEEDDAAGGEEDMSEDDSADADIEEDDVGDPSEDEDPNSMELSSDDEDSDNPFTIAGSETKALLDKYEGAVTVYEEDGGEPSLYGAVVRVLTEDTFVVIDEDGNPYTVKTTMIGDDGDAVKLVGSMQSADTASQQEVDAAETVDLGENQVRLMSMTGKDNSEVAVFVGQRQIATLVRSRAHEIAAPLFDNGERLMAAFKPTLRTHYGNSKAPELAQFGYVPVTFKVKTHKLFEQRLQREVAKVSKNTETAATNKFEDFAANLELAFVGINKGFFETKHELATEMAGLLRRAGVAQPELEVRKLLAKHTKSYVGAAIEQAKNLNDQPKEYLNGLTDSLKKSSFMVNETASAPYVRDVPVAHNTPQTELAGFETAKPKQENRFSSLISSIRR